MTPLRGTSLISDLLLRVVLSVGWQGLGRVNSGLAPNDLASIPGSDRNTPFRRMVLCCPYSFLPGGVKARTHLHRVLKLRMHGALSIGLRRPPHAFMARFTRSYREYNNYDCWVQRRRPSAGLDSRTSLRSIWTETPVLEAWELLASSLPWSEHLVLVESNGSLRSELT
jgi:hypothetical protein